MKRRTMWIAGAILVLALGLSGCAASGVTVPDREVPISVETALEAQNMAMGALMGGGVQLNESQFSSLLTELLKANSGEANPVETITAWFEPGMLYLRVNLKEGVLPAAFGTTLDLAGGLTVQGGKLAVNLQQAAAGNYAVSGAMLAPISAQINNALAAQQLGIPVSVEIGEGTLSLSLTQ